MKAKIFFILLMCVILNFSAKAQISLSYTSTDIMCYGDTNGVIGIVVSGGTLPYQYLWNNGATSQILINLGAGTYSVTVIDNVGSTGSLSIALTQPDQIQLSTSSDQTICMGQAANLIAAVNGGTPPYTYHWTPGGYTTGSIMVSPMQSTEYCVYVTDIVGCQSNQQCVTVFVYPPLQIQASASADSICQGDSVTIFANFSGGTGGPYSALLSDGTTSEIISPPYELNPVYTTTYIITVNDFCGTPSVSDTITITVSPLPEFTISSNIVNGCAPLTIGFYSTINQQDYTHQWCFGDINSASNYSNMQNPSHIYNDPGIYEITYTVTSNYGCTKTVNLHEDIIVYPIPVVDISASFVNASTVSFTNNSIGSDTLFVIYGDGDTAIVSSSTFEHTYSSIGIYNVLFFAKSIYGCWGTLNAILNLSDGTFITVDIHEFQSRQEVNLQISPNPINELAYISYYLPLRQFIEISIYNLNGDLKETIFTGEMSAGEHSTLVNVSNYMSGVYLCRAKSPLFSSSTKMIIMR